MFTIDTSVHINALNQAEAGSHESRAFLEYVYRRSLSIFSPTLLLVEVAAVVARVFDNPAQGIAFAKSVRLIPRQVWVPLDDVLAEEASRMAAEYRLRGADAVYAAVARRNNTTLVTLDRQQLERLSQALPVRRPAELVT